MIVETTVVMNSDVRSALECAKRISGKSNSELIRLAMKRMMAKRGGMARAFRRVEYQVRGGEWKRTHISVIGRDYEFFVDMRLLFKRSVSLLIAMAIERHLEEILKDNCTDNYLFQNYVLCEDTADSVVCWKIYWGIPEKPEKIFK